MPKFGRVEANPIRVVEHGGALQGVDEALRPIEVEGVSLNPTLEGPGDLGSW
jgi:hypothetical protein